MEIALNPQTKRKTSVAVSMKDGERKFGSDAMIVCVKSPKHCYYYLLDLLGKKIDHPAVVAYQARFPQYQLEADPERGTVLFRHDAETVYSVEEEERQKSEEKPDEEQKDVNNETENDKKEPDCIQKEPVAEREDDIETTEYDISTDDESLRMIFSSTDQVIQDKYIIIYIL